MDIAEAVVERFVTANASAGEGVAFVCPQYSLRDTDHPGWIAELDFVVLQFLPTRQSKVLLIEVSDSGGLGSVATKAEQFEIEQYRERLARQIADQTNGLTSGWEIEFLGFVRTEELVRQARRKYGASNIHFRSLEEAFLDGWWQKREAGLLPSLPCNESQS